ncbi:hypothetical protein LR48_Vigan03g106500 [Vigna angularis]|uniref:Uncharacterized protein n=1 Tax=Phaseolus angularis TaxID=3914 RepID=A0A0L9U4D0_PHAAN|nr:hypothetical protein LR48_Vigan03g106500 [Vigna angularis]
MATNDNELNSERGASIQQKGVLQLQSNDALLAQNKILTQQLENLTKILAQLPKELKTVAQVQPQVCELCGGDHINGQCAFPMEALEDVNFMANQFPYRQGNFNQGWKPHPKCKVLVSVNVEKVELEKEERKERGEKEEEKICVKIEKGLHLLMNVRRKSIY